MADERLYNFNVQTEMAYSEFHRPESLMRFGVSELDARRAKMFDIDSVEVRKVQGKHRPIAYIETTRQNVEDKAGNWTATCAFEAPRRSYVVQTVLSDNINPCSKLKAFDIRLFRIRNADGKIIELEPHEFAHWIASDLKEIPERFRERNAA